MSRIGLEKLKRSIRRYMSFVKIAKRIKQARSRFIDTKVPHKLSKTNPFTCGSSTCHMCGNPRKLYKDRTIQEKRFIQTEKFVFEDTTDY